MGDDKLPIDPLTHEISMPRNFCHFQSSIEYHENMVFPNITNNLRNHDWLCESVIRVPKNDDLNRINDRVELKIPGAVTEYKSIDTVTDENDATNYTDKFLNALEISGIPQHKLLLKTESPILLLRNLNKQKLCNITRLSVKKMMPNVIEEAIINTKIPEDSKLANIVANGAKMVAKVAKLPAKSVVKNDAKLALSPRFRQVLIESPL
ncbi:ATP-dependent DNA helicase [Trichonephila clavipes]|uniref:ATP-dependent DNA helicase n=1 Tax=Trichonephila clavipes TaxID=2585209 RepID=A0A8X6VHD6_TRICX|nr:ATP-dependent DNA helicase [Trichonephila clavipes]